MSIQFSCPSCGHAIQVDDRFAGLPGHCKHCGRAMTVPAAVPEAVGLKLRPVEDDAGHAHAAARPPAAPLQVRPLAHDHDVAPPTRAEVMSKADERPIELLDYDHRVDGTRRAPRFQTHYDTKLARFAARVLRETRDRLYLVTVGLLVLGLIGFLFKLKGLLHLAAVGIVATNILMLVDGVLYLFVLPFQHSLGEGLGTLFPPYAVYYWYRHWGRMKRPVVNTARSFTPILLVGIAYALYEEAPVIEAEFEKVEKAVGIEPGRAPAAQPRRPGVAEQAGQVIGQESRIIQDLAQPQ